MKNYAKFAGIVAIGVLSLTPVAFARVGAELGASANANVAISGTAPIGPLPPVREHLRTAWGVITAVNGNTITFSTAASAKTQQTWTVDVSSAQIYVDKALSNAAALKVGLVGNAHGKVSSNATGTLTADIVRVHTVRAWGKVSAVNSGTSFTFTTGKGHTFTVNDGSAQIFVNGSATSGAAIATGMVGYADGGWTDNTKTAVNATIVRVHTTK